MDGVEHGACAVCGTRDARLLMMVELPGGVGATLCGSHALMHSRMAEKAATIADLRRSLAERRDHDRRSASASGERDELAERLSSAFTNERRSTERRAG